MSRRIIGTSQLYFRREPMAAVASGAPTDYLGARLNNWRARSREIRYIVSDKVVTYESAEAPGVEGSRRGVIRCRALHCACRSDRAFSIAPSRRAGPWQPVLFSTGSLHYCLNSQPGRRRFSPDRYVYNNYIVRDWLPSAIHTAYTRSSRVWRLYYFWPCDISICFESGYVWKVIYSRRLFPCGLGWKCDFGSSKTYAAIWTGRVNCCKLHIRITRAWVLCVYI